MCGNHGDEETQGQTEVPIEARALGTALPTVPLKVYEEFRKKIKENCCKL